MFVHHPYIRDCDMGNGSLPPEDPRDFDHKIPEPDQDDGKLSEALESEKTHQEGARVSATEKNSSE